MRLNHLRMKPQDASEELIITETRFVHVYVDVKHDGAQQVADRRPEHRHGKQNGCKGQSGV